MDIYTSPLQNWAITDIISACLSNRFVYFTGNIRAYTPVHSDTPPHPSMRTYSPMYPLCASDTCTPNAQTAPHARLLPAVGAWLQVHTARGPLLDLDEVCPAALRPQNWRRYVHGKSCVCVYSVRNECSVLAALCNRCYQHP